MLITLAIIPEETKNLRISRFRITYESDDYLSILIISKIYYSKYKFRDGSYRKYRSFKEF